MKTVEEYLAHALVCDVLAAEVEIGEREQVLHIAELWRLCGLNFPPAGARPDAYQYCLGI